jgi:hypothetical protein
MSKSKAVPLAVIALVHFTDKNGDFHPYGHEFEMADTPERAELIERGVIREDDRRSKFSAPPAAESPTE